VLALREHVHSFSGRFAAARALKLATERIMGSAFARSVRIRKPFVAHRKRLAVITTSLSLVMMRD
jgi:hypothetical protein